MICFCCAPDIRIADGLRLDAEVLSHNSSAMCVPTGASRTDYLSLNSYSARPYGTTLSRLRSNRRGCKCDARRHTTSGHSCDRRRNDRHRAALRLPQEKARLSRSRPKLL
jgi:hypothetical protein